ncbi:FAS-associated death domain protein [Carlito syrichta]|uniref:FAS-associated death domain protein n=1 Tax=Carlito syrichta TaxID=1868482 RepID=A0A1U7TPD2_CARSF|nr:FAS-associated death domain protein [Carlito syrichta]
MTPVTADVSSSSKHHCWPVRFLEEPQQRREVLPLARRQVASLITPPPAKLQAAFDVICDNVGRDWRRLARQLRVSDAKIDAIEDRHPRNLTERVRESLRTWKDTEKEQATVAHLVEALRACRMNLVADLVEEDQQTRALHSRAGAASPMSMDSDVSAVEAS